ncbi:thermonuclease family protein [Rhizobium sp.]
MTKAARFSPKRKKPAPPRGTRRKIGRDLFGVLAVGLGIGLSLSSTGIDLGGLRSLINNASAQVREMASDSKAPVESDRFPVSSIKGKFRVEQGNTRSYPVCSGGGTRLNCVVDGDTFYMNGKTIRISDIDAPETHPPRCAYEADLGDRATRRLVALLSAGPFLLARQNRDTDKYGRQLRIVLRDGRSLGKVMVGEGLARPWTGKRRPWCGDQNAPTG